MGMAPTVEDATRPRVMPWPEAGLDREAIMRMCGDGILVTGFNGGNSNAATGDYSFGIEGFEFKEGRITHPVREMLMTGNLITLWNSLLAAGDDARRCLSRLTPTLAFEAVDISGE
jgi:PmbA protein